VASLLDPVIVQSPQGAIQDGVVEGRHAAERGWKRLNGAASVPVHGAREFVAPPAAIQDPAKIDRWRARPEQSTRPRLHEKACFGTAKVGTADAGESQRCGGNLRPPLVQPRAELAPTQTTRELTDSSCSLRSLLSQPGPSQARPLEVHRLVCPERLDAGVDAVQKPGCW